MANRQIQYKYKRGYYYIQNTYEFRQLTDDEVDYLPEYIFDKVVSDNGYTKGALHLEEYQTHLDDHGQNVLYYVKEGKAYIGKLTIIYRVVGSGFWVQAYYYKRHFQSLRQRASRRSPKAKAILFQPASRRPKDYHKFPKFGREQPRK